MRAILLLPTCFAIWAQSPALRMQRLGLEDGLSQSSVFCALEDHLGFLWFGTANGLNRFDGYAFQVFHHDPKRLGSLSNDWIFDMDEDAQGHLWVGTRAGINHFNRADGTFTQYLDGQVTAVLVDQAGAVWAGTTQGLFVRRSSDDAFTPIPIGWDPGLYTAHAQIRALAESPDRALWVGTPGACTDSTQNEPTPLGWEESPTRCHCATQPWFKTSTSIATPRSPSSPANRPRQHRSHWTKRHL